MLKFNKKEGGFFLIEAMIALIIFGTIAALGMQQYIESQQDDNAKYAGQRLAIYNSAVRSFLGANATTIVTGTTYTDVNWLRTVANCGAGNGSGAVDYLPCSFSSTLPFNMTYSTVFTKAAGVTTADTNLGNIFISGAVRVDLSEISRKSAQGAGSSVGSQVNAASPITASTYTDYIVTYTAGVTEGDVHALVSNSNTNDAWLRTDGSNKMLADLDNGWNNIKNVKSIGVGKAPTNINGEIVSSGRIQTDSFVDATGEGLIPVRLGGTRSSNLTGSTLTTSSLGELILDSKTGQSAFVNWSSQGAVYTRTGNNSKYNYGNGWGLLALDNAGASTIVPKTLPGSININDVYLRSKGRWLSDLVPNIVFKASQNVVNGSIIQKPACDAGGVAKIYIIPRAWNSIGVGYEYDWYATNLGLTWRAELLLNHPVFGGGGPVAGYLISSIAQLYCQYY